MIPPALAMLPWGKILSVVAVITVIGSGFLYVNHLSASVAKLTSERDQLKVENETARKNFDAIVASVNRTNDLLVAREKEYLAIKKSFAAVRQDLAQLKETDPHAKDWMDTPVPRSVLERLSAYSSEDGNALPHTPAAADARLPRTPTAGE